MEVIDNIRWVNRLVLVWYSYYLIWAFTLYINSISVMYYIHLTLSMPPETTRYCFQQLSKLWDLNNGWVVKVIVVCFGHEPLCSRFSYTGLYRLSFQKGPICHGLRKTCCWLDKLNVILKTTVYR